MSTLVIADNPTNNLEFAKIVGNVRMDKYHVNHHLTRLLQEWPRSTAIVSQPACSLNLTANVSRVRVLGTGIGVLMWVL
jgi:hypothetical protein